MRGVRSTHTLSFGALYIEAWHRSLGEAKDTLLGPATGFLVGFPGDYWLVTAWHVLSGRRSDNGEAMRDDGLRPDYLRVRFAGEGDDGFRPINRDFELYNEEF
ncbi:hypothetical protein [Streptomyces heilongjiangensis]|uniref:Serine protease n=1 Tax=Streptomyces heilongjiangensis TaxID=945052 RepID=A0ABW1BJW4_9ACTN|nr:hypothetical protein [Streptomyces heilongjiangensis]MDC2951949.1 hypothetical protein [Streptomyces heilongjiangensis]